MKEYNLTLEEAVAYVNHRSPQYMKLFSANNMTDSFVIGGVSQIERPYYLDGIDLKEMVRNGTLACDKRDGKYFFSVEDLQNVQKMNDAKIRAHQRQIGILFLIGIIVCIMIFLWALTP